MSVSVVVPAYNAAQTLPACMQALARQTQPPNEIIVVDDGSTDATARVATEFGARCITIAHGGPAAARNAGARAAHGQLVLFTDADCEPAPDWVAQLVHPFTNPYIVGVKGAYRTRQRAGLPRLVQAEFEDKYARMRARTWIDFVDTYSAAYRREVLLTAGGFQEVFPVASVEDVELSFRLAAQGAKLVFRPQAIVWHRHPTTLGLYLRRKARYGFWRALLYTWHPQKIRGDAHTDPVLKWQLALAGLASAAGGAALLQAGWWPLPVLVCLLLLATTSGFVRRTWRRDRLAAVLAPPVHVVRAFAQGWALAVGLLVHLLFPGFVARQTRVATELE